ncbi:flagellar assembly protein FliW [Paenibacillus caui]|uniref:flagellar assembly protein FliW n=1 Tax=Paenibacillus caui TaxID=2873927 RepID=UPI001CA8AAAF|nr:flagellar assembly protein FliW [Paenibacillus caui]
MKVIQSPVYGPLELSANQIYKFETEILGISDIHDYGLFPLADTSFFVLHALQEDVSFILLPAHEALENYSFKISDEVVELLKLESPDDVGVMLIVNIQNSELYANLMAPILLSPHSLRGIQYILKDQDMPIRYLIKRKEGE